MAEFCLSCYNKINGTKHSQEDVVLSDELDLCEYCGEWKEVVVCEKNYYGQYTNLFVDLLVWLFEAVKGIFKRMHKKQDKKDIH